MDNIDVSKITESIQSLADNTYELLSNSFTKLGITDEDKSNTRLTICNACEHYNTSIKQCKKCGCFMPLKSKLSMAKCPIGMW